MKHSIALIIAGQFFSSCFGPSLVKESHAGELSESDSKLSDRDPENDDSYYDEYEFEAAEGMVITVSLNSDAFDAYLHLLGPDGRRLEDHDDIVEQENTNSRIRCLAPVAGTYSVIANSYDPGETGAYQVELETTKAEESDAGLKRCGVAAGGAAAAPQPSAPTPSAEQPAGGDPGVPSGVQVVP